MRSKRNLVMVKANLAMLAIASVAQTAPAGCSNRTLSGNYAVRVSGEIFVPNSDMIAVYQDGVAMTHFDGNGGCSGVDCVVATG